MGVIKSTDINNLNSNVYTLGTKSKFSTNLSTKFQSSTGNNVSTNSIVKPLNVNELKTAINILESKFSNNCCQSQCHTYNTVSSCQVSTCQKCQACQYCQGACQSCQVCQYCQSAKPYSEYSKHSDYWSDGCGGAG